MIKNVILYDFYFVEFIDLFFQLIALLYLLFLALLCFFVRNRSQSLIKMYFKVNLFD